MEHESLREKIAKLLRLSESPNEHEAQLALLYAQRLMAEHKLSMRDFTSKKVQVTQKYTGISFSKRGNIWIFSLSGVLAKNYCCKLLLAHISHKQLREVTFVGTKEDVEICNYLLQFAVKFILDHRTQLKKRGLKGERLKIKVNGFGCGFAKGLENALKEQRCKNDEWGLVMAAPKEAMELVNNLANRTINISPIEISQSDYDHGYREGIAFGQRKRIDKS